MNSRSSTTKRKECKLFLVKNLRIYSMRRRLVMINIWDYRDANRIKITVLSGQVFIGELVCIDDASDLDIAFDDPEDMLSIQTDDGRAVGFRQSEIVEIERLEERGWRNDS